jgi:hypothetical protein
MAEMAASNSKGPAAAARGIGARLLETRAEPMAFGTQISLIGPCSF